MSEERGPWSLIESIHRHFLLTLPDSLHDYLEDNYRSLRDLVRRMQEVEGVGGSVGMESIFFVDTYARDQEKAEEVAEKLRPILRDFMAKHNLL